EYAGQRKLVILVCPGEKGTKSLPIDNEHITSYFYEASDNLSDVKWSKEALQQFDIISNQVIKENPDILIVDGFHALWSHIMNRTTDGDFLAGLDIGSDSNPYASAKLYSQAHNAFGQYITGLYHSQVQTIIATTWEEYEAGTSGNPQQQGAKIQDTRY